MPEKSYLVWSNEHSPWWGAPRVRPLVWDRDGGEWWADTGLGRDLHYWIYPAAAHSQWILAFCSTILSIHDSWEEAQAAAQADFERRVRAVLETPAGKPTENRWQAETQPDGSVQIEPESGTWSLRIHGADDAEVAWVARLLLAAPHYASAAEQLLGGDDTAGGWLDGLEMLKDAHRRREVPRGSSDV